MTVLVFKTNIQNERMVECLAPVFKGKHFIDDWSVDTEDIDHVLRIVAKTEVSEFEVIRMVNNIGIACEVMQD